MTHYQGRQSKSESGKAQSGGMSPPFPDIFEKQI